MPIDRVAELEIQLQQARAETKILGKKAHGTLAEWSLELDDDKRHELVKRSIEQHQRLLDSGAVVLRLHKELRKLTHNDKENEFDSFAISQVERGLETSADPPIGRPCIVLHQRRRPSQLAIHDCALH